MNYTKLKLTEAKRNNFGSIEMPTLYKRYINKKKYVGGVVHTLDCFNDRV